MKYLKILIFIILASSYNQVEAQVCDILIPICSSQDGLNNNAIDPSPLTIQTTCQTLQGTRTAYYLLLIDQPTDFTFQIEPTGNVDYDFAVWVNADCANLGVADRGSFDAPGAGEYDTGLDLTSTDLCETAAGDGDVMFLSLVPGDEVIIVVDRFSSTPDNFDLTFGDPDAFNCSIVNTEACEGDTVTLDATDPMAINYVWTYDDGVNPPMEIFNGPGFNTIDVTQPGTYTCQVQFSGGGENILDFTVVFYPVPVVASPPLDLFICDDGTTPGNFDLTENDDDVLGAQDPATFEISYHNSQADADSGANPIATPTNYTITGTSEEIFVRIQHNSGLCYDTASFFIIYSQVTAGPMTPLTACDQDGDGSVSIDLAGLKDAEALNGLDPLEFDVTYHATQADADNDAAPFPNPYVTTNASETIFVRVENIATNTCYATDSFMLTVTTAPSATPPTPYELCDMLPNDGIATFDLETKNDEITGGPNPNASITYYLSQSDAQAGLNPILNPNTFDNTNVGFQTVYARVEDINSPDCFNIVPVDLVVNDAPMILDPIPDMLVCDNDGDGTELFDLASRTAEILDQAVNVTLTFHNTQGDADMGINAINPDNAYPSGGGEVIWVRAQNYENGDPVNGAPLCHTVSSFSLVLGTVPVYTEVNEFGQCDSNGDGMELFELSSQNDAITGGNPNLNVTYYPTQGDAMAQTNELPNMYSSTGEQIWVRVEDISGCYGVFAMDLVVLTPPEIFEPAPLIFCDDNNDGFGVFTLSEADEDVVNGNPAGNLVVSYHLTMADAINGVLPLDTTTYNNEMQGSQIVFVLLTDTATGCTAITTLELIVRDSPAISPPGPLTRCDESGFAQFDLTESEAEVLAGLDPTLYTVSYYVDMAQSSMIGNPTMYTNVSNPQTVYIMVTNNDPSNPENTCSSSTELVLQVNTPPVLTDPQPLMLCDTTDIVGPGDELEIFDLTEATLDITGGDISILVSYYETLQDAMDDTNVIDPDTGYQNTSNPQTIYIRAEDVSTGCVVSDGMVTLDLIVNPVPLAVTPTALEVCDDDTDGISNMFDLESKNAEITTDPDVTVTYHENSLDAQTGAMPLASPYENIVANNQIIFARVTYTNPPNDTGCFSVVPLELIVNPTPQVSMNLPDLVACDDDNFAIFDLTQRAPDIYGFQSTDLELTYHLSAAAAFSGTGAIVNTTSYANTSNPQTIYVRLEDPVTGCFGTGSFELVVSQGPSIVAPSDFEVCDDLGQVNDGVFVFDLTSKNDEITMGAGPEVVVGYYLTAQDAQDDVNIIDPDEAFTNTSNPQTLYVRVTGENGCVSFTDLDLRVIPNPEPTAPAAQEQCDVTEVVGPGVEDGVEIFDLNDSTSEILNGNTGLTVSFYEDLSAAIDGTFGAIPPSDTATYANTSNPQIIYVRVESQTTGCFEIVELELIVNELPDDSAVVSDYDICDEDPFDGEAFFDLDSKTLEILGPDQSPSDYVVTFYEDAIAAASGSGAIAQSSNYLNQSNPQEIFTGIKNIETGCYKGGEQSFMIEVLQGAVATTPAEPFVICDNDGAVGDGIAIFDLTDTTDDQVVALRQEILGSQTAPDYALTFHESEASAAAGTPQIAFPYTNLVNPQVVYARVTFVASGCFEVVELILKVDPTPDVVLEESYRLCVDDTGAIIEEEEGASSPPVIDTGLDGSLYSFAWEINGELQVGETDPAIVAMETGSYVVTVTNLETGCEAMAETTVVESSPPLVYDAVVTSGAFAGTHVVEASAEGLGVYEFQLDNGAFQESGIFEGVDPGTHTVTIKDVNGCGSVTIEVGVIDYPRVVTPNQDGFHDRWNITGIAAGDPTAKIYIFDRYGKLLKQLSPSSPGWDGTYNGNPLPSSDYWFRVEYTEDDQRKEFKGHFTLKR